MTTDVLHLTDYDHRARNARDAPRRILVVANEIVASDYLERAIASCVGADGADVLVVAPALNTRLGHWLSADGDARSAAEERLILCLASLRAAGVDAEGYVGDADPLLAIEDADRLFAPDEIVVATHPAGRSNWLARNLVESARTVRSDRDPRRRERSRRMKSRGHQPSDGSDATRDLSPGS